VLLALDDIVTTPAKQNLNPNITKLAGMITELACCENLETWQP
jgi:hypothetical protein